MERIDLRSDTVTLPSDAMRTAMAQRAGRRRPVRRGPDRPRAAGADRRAARQGGGDLRAQRHDGEPDRPQAADPSWRRCGGGRRGAHRLARVRAPRRRIPACSSPWSDAAGCSPRRICAPRSSRRATSSFRRPRWWRSRTRTTAAAAWCSRRTTPWRSARRRASLAWRRIWMARGCSTRRWRPGVRLPSWRRRSMWCRSRCRRGLAARWAA